MNNLTVCGGLNEADETLHTCFKYDFDSEWSSSHQLVNPRCRHVSWDVEGSLYLIGGIDAFSNAIPSYEIVSEDGVTEHETQFQPE